MSIMLVPKMGSMLEPLSILESLLRACLSQERGPSWNPLSGLKSFLSRKWGPCWNPFSGQVSCLSQKWGPCWNRFLGQVSCLSQKWGPCWNPFSGQESFLSQKWGPCWNPFRDKCHACPKVGSMLEPLFGTSAMLIPTKKRGVLPSAEVFGTANIGDSA